MITWNEWITSTGVLINIWTAATYEVNHLKGKDGSEQSNWVHEEKVVRV